MRNPCSLLFNAVLFGTLWLFASCAGSLNTELLADGSASLKINLVFEPHFMRSLSNLSGDGADFAFDTESMGRALLAVEGVKQAKLSSPAPSRISGDIDIANLTRFLNISQDGMMTVDRSPLELLWLGPAVGQKRPGKIKLFLDINNAPLLMQTISPDIVEYLFALMAPLASGEKMDREEYLETIAILYGPGLAGEIGSALFTFSLRLPGTIKTASQGKAQGSRLIWTLPLTDLLVLEKPLDLDIEWTE